VLARTRAGRLPLRRVEVSLKDLVEEAAARFAARGRIRVAAADQRVSVDPVRLRQALQNLLDNAVRHGGGTVRVAAARRDGVLRIEVTDDGPGFPAELLEVAFEPFARGSAASDGDAGAGLGLAIVRAVAAAHGGRASARNLEGGGARVLLLLRV
jgi:two-component system, OmpR family, sensor kinase